MTDDLLAGLGIPASYGHDPHRPRYAVATALVDVEHNIVGAMQRLAPATASAWRAMKAAAAEDGISLVLVSAFRSIERQAELIHRKLAAGQRLEDVLEVIAAPGFSQHHTGQAIDVATLGCPPLTEAFEATPAFAWLTARAGAYGFSMSYDRGNPFGFAYEPWHWSTL